MAKRKETIEIEQVLHSLTRDNRIYGCEEVTIGFANQGKGNEVVDFMTMDSKGIIKCYEIKVTMNDLKSKAKKSWYGNYNYLFVTNELYKKIECSLDDFIPKHIGVATILESGRVKKVSIRRPAKEQKIELEIQIMLKESLVRSMYYKMIKYMDASAIEKQQELKKKISCLEREKQSAIKERGKAQNVIYLYEKYRTYNDDIDDFCLEEQVAIEKSIYEKNVEKRKI